MCDVKAALRAAAGFLLAAALLILPAGARADAPEPWTPEDPLVYEDLVRAARAFFDLDQELWKGRRAFLEQLEQHAKAGTFHLRDMNALRWLVYQARSFDPDMRDRRWQRAHGIGEAKSLAGTLYGIKAEDLQISFSLPRTYPQTKDLGTKFPRVPPLPLLLCMHEEKDSTGGRHPGEVLVERRYPEEVWGPLFDSWAVLIPEAPAGDYVDRDGTVRSEAFKAPFAKFWRHYHIDFERVVLDGSDQAFTVAAAMPVFFAGIVFRGDWTLETDEQRAAVRNFAPVPVYVVDNEVLADQLAAAGHGQVTAGNDAGLPAWMAKRRRVPPKRFEWNAQRPDHPLAHWINLDSLDSKAPRRTLRVAVLDTAADPNTICLETRGIRSISLFLDDDTVDLDRSVRVVLNGDVVHDGPVEAPPQALTERGLTRDVDLLFNTEPVRIRSSMFFGWLKSARLVRLDVRDPMGTSACLPVAPEPAEVARRPKKPPAAVEEPVTPPESAGAPPVEPPARSARPEPTERPPKPRPEDPGLPTGIVIALAFLLLLLLLLLLLRRRR